MNAYGPTMTRLIEQLEMLPGVGRKSAERLAYFLMIAPAEKSLGLAQAIRDAAGTRMPVAICKDDRTEAIAVLRLDDFLALWRATWAGRQGS